jgi:hypothetical protein
MAVDLSAISGFEWDEGNGRKNQGKHGVSQTEAEEVFLVRPPLVVPDTSHGAVELRYHALGRTREGRHLHVTFTLRHRGTMIRVISARTMNRKERRIYAHRPQTTTDLPNRTRGTRVLGEP